MIIADGKTDNTKALQEWANAGAVDKLPSGIIRTTESIVIGGKVVTNWTDPNSINLDEYQKAKYTKAIDIEGNGTCIWLDNPDKTKPVIIYSALGWNTFKKSGKISNLTLRGNGIGLLAGRTSQLQLHNITFEGFATGLVMNGANFTKGEMLNFQNCERAEFDIRSHSSSFTNTTVGSCKKGWEVRSNQMSFRVYYASLCDIGLHVVGGSNTFDCLYLETSKATTAQLLIGEATGRTINNNVFINPTISAPGVTAIHWEKTAGTMTVLGGEIQSTLFKITGKPMVTVSSLTGTLPKEIVKQ